MTNSDQTPSRTPGSSDRDGAEPLLDEVVDPIGRITRAIWWLVLLRGIFAVIFGIIALLAPVTALYAVVFVFAAYAIVDGIVGIVHAFRVRDRDRRWGWLLASGIIAVLAGAVALVFPGIAGVFYATFVLAIIAIYAVMTGISGFPAAASMTDGGRKALGYIVSVLSILLGVVLAIVLLVNPVIAVFNLIWVVGIWAVVIGITLIIAAISARAAAARSGSGAAPARG